MTLLRSDNIHIRFVTTAEVDALLDLHLRNRYFFQKYMPTREESYYTYESQLSSIERWAQECQDDVGYSFGIYHNDTEELIGTIMLAEVERDPLQSCYLGYILDEAHNGRGYTTEAIRLIVRYAFDELRLHRIEAGVQPCNVASVRVLEKTGFHKEGISRKNILIDGV